MEKINERMERIEDMKREKYLLDEERRKIEDEMNNKKDVMMGRLRKVMKSDEYFTRNEIIDYVLHDIKPNSHKNDGKNQNNHNENTNRDGKENEEKENKEKIKNISYENNNKNKEEKQDEKITPNNNNEK